MKSTKIFLIFQFCPKESLGESYVVPESVRLFLDLSGVQSTSPETSSVTTKETRVFGAIKSSQMINRYLKTDFTR